MYLQLNPCIFLITLSMLTKLTVKCSSTKHTHTHTHTHTQSFVAFPLQQWLNERARMLRYVYIACRFPTANDTKAINALPEQK